MSRPLVILWWGSHAVLAGPDGTLVRSALPADASGEAALLRLWDEEFTGNAAARLVLAPDDPPSGPVAVRLAAAARRQRRRIEGAWPLAALLETANPCPTLQVVAIGSAAAVRFRSPTGEDTLRYFAGPRWAENAQAEILEARVRVDEGGSLPATLTLDDSPAAPALRSALAGTEVRDTGLDAWLDRARTLPAGEPGDLLSGRGRRLFGGRHRRRGAAAALALLAGAVALTGVQIHRRQVLAAARAAQSLWAESAAAERRQAELARARAARAAAFVPPQRHAEFLAALVAASPSAVVVESLVIEADRFDLRGRILGEAPGHERAAADLREALFAAGRPWQEDTTTPVPAGQFALCGRFAEPPADPAAADRPQAAAEPNLAGILARWAPGWRIERQADRYVLVPADLGPAAWAGLVGLTGRICARPGLAIARLEAHGAPRGDGAFTRMELVLTAR